MFIRRHRQRLNQRGDTIAEVLIVIGVLSLVLAGAFVLTNNSLQSARSAHERLIAIKLVETQLEQIKSIAASTSAAKRASIFGAIAPNPFCINNTGSVVGASNGACRIGLDGAATTGQPAFQLGITRTGNTFSVTNSWDSVTGRSKETIKMTYRVYE